MGRHYYDRLRGCGDAIALALARRGIHIPAVSRPRAKRASTNSKSKQLKIRMSGKDKSLLVIKYANDFFVISIDVNQHAMAMAE
jgi:hypothetical protein